MKNALPLITALLFSILLTTGCASSEEKEAESIIGKQVSVTEQYINGLDGAKSADDVAKTIHQYTEGMKELMPMLLDFNKKHPEYMQDGKVPQGIEEEAAHLEELSEKIQPAMMKTMQYMADPKVQQAMQNMAQEMSKMGQ